MKKATMLTLLVALISPVVSAVEVWVPYIDTIKVADTTAQEQHDTTYSPWFFLPEFGTNFWFTTQINKGTTAEDTAIATDTFVVILQHASTRQGATTLDATFDRTNLTVQTIALTSADNDTLVKSTIKLRADSTWTGQWARAMFIYNDSATNGLGRTSSLQVGDIRRYDLRLWINGFLK